MCAACSQLQPPDPRQLWDAAVAVLRANHVGGWTKPAPRLYPHQWSWDSAFVAVGLAHVDPERALLELESLCTAQWADGRVPHIVYSPNAPPGEYFPDAARWACAELSTAAPRQPATSGIVQPPAHAIAAWSIWKLTAVRGRHLALLPRFQVLYGKLLAWHRYLATARDPDGSGLLTIYHPWESGTDNSPRWDAPLANVVLGDLPPFTRRDLQHVADPLHRPTDAEYDRYLWLVECLKRAHYEDAEIHRAHPFLVKDVLFSAIFALASEALGWLAERLDRPAAEREQLAAWRTRSSAAVQDCWNADERLALDVDLRLGRAVRARTCAGLAPLLVPDLDASLADQLENRLWDAEFAGAPRFAHPVVPSTAPGSPGFNARSYWRGPTWPFFNWLLCWALRRLPYPDCGRASASRLQAANLALLRQPHARFAEYFEPYTGEPLGSLDQSWTAAVTLDWLATE